MHGSGPISRGDADLALLPQVLVALLPLGLRLRLLLLRHYIYSINSG